MDRGGDEGRNGGEGRRERWSGVWRKRVREGRREQREGKGWSEPEVWKERRRRDRCVHCVPLSLRVTCM